MAQYLKDTYRLTDKQIADVVLNEVHIEGE